MRSREPQLGRGRTRGGVARDAALLYVLAAAFLLAGACTSTPSPSGGVSSTAADGRKLVDPCSLLSRGQVEATLPGDVTQVRELAPDDFHSPPSGDFVGCAYETDGRYGELVVATESMPRPEYQDRYVDDPLNTRNVSHVGEDARFSACGGLSVYSDGDVLHLGIQFADCGALRHLVPLARAALPHLR
jgi:hypothetical protein